MGDAISTQAVGLWTLKAHRISQNSPLTDHHTDFFRGY